MRKLSASEKHQCAFVATDRVRCGYVRLADSKYCDLHAPRRWDLMPEAARALAVRELMASGHTNVSAASVLGATSGAVAGIRRRHNIPSTHPAQGGFKNAKEKTQAIQPRAGDVAPPETPPVAPVIPDRAGTDAAPRGADDHHPNPEGLVAAELSHGDAGR